MKKIITWVIIIAVILYSGYYLWNYYHYKLSPTRMVKTDESITLNNNDLSLEIAPPLIDRVLEGQVIVTVKKVPIDSDKIFVVLSKEELHSSPEIQKKSSVIMHELAPIVGQGIIIDLNKIPNGTYNLGAVSQNKEFRDKYPWSAVVQIQGLFRK